MGDVLKPASALSASTTNGSVSSTGQQSQTAGQAPQSNPTGKVLTGDLDSSLASLAENLTMNKSQWNSPKNTAKAGSTGWSPQPMAATTNTNYRPMVRINIFILLLHVSIDFCVQYTHLASLFYSFFS